VLWAVAWLIVFVGGWWLTHSSATLVFSVALAIFGLGECFHGTVQNALVADLSQPGLLGRYMAVNNVAFQLGGAAGRAVGGFALALAPHGMWIAAAAVAAGAGTSALALERFIPAPLRRTPRRGLATA
jgi:MFS family permease